MRKNGRINPVVIVLLEVILAVVFFIVFFKVVLPVLFDLITSFYDELGNVTVSALTYQSVLDNIGEFSFPDSKGIR